MSPPSTPAVVSPPRQPVVFLVPCGCEVDVGLPRVAYRFCPEHHAATRHEPGPTAKHVQWIWQTCAEDLRSVYDLQRAHLI